jgi:hypothetical protein
MNRSNYRPRQSLASNRKNKKSSNKRSNRNANYTTYTNGVFGFIAPRKLVELRYEDFVTVGNLATTTANQYIFRLGSIFDPDRTGAGHQPYGHDTLALLYNRYRVNRVSYQIEFPSNADTLIYAVVPVNGSLQAVTTLADFDLACEVPYSTHAMTGFAGTPNAVLTGVIDLAQLNGAKRIEYETDDRFQAMFGSNPTEVIDLNVLTYNPATSMQAVRFHIQMKFFIEVYDPILQAIS